MDLDRLHAAPHHLTLLDDAALLAISQHAGDREGLGTEADGNLTAVGEVRDIVGEVGERYLDEHGVLPHLVVFGDLQAPVEDLRIIGLDRGSELGRLPVKDIDAVSPPPKIEAAVGIPLVVLLDAGPPFDDDVGEETSLDRKSVV